MAVLHAGVQANMPLPQLGRQFCDQLAGFFAFDMAGAIVNERIALTINKIHAESDALRAKVNTHTRRLQRRTTGIVDPSVVAKDLKIADITAGQALGRDHLHHPADAFPSQAIHIRGLGRLQWRLPTKFVERVVSCSVGHQHHILHLEILHSNQLYRSLHRIQGADLSKRPLHCGLACLVGDDYQRYRSTV